MPKRKKVPEDVKLAVLTEAGFRCAVPNCHGILAIDLHHIIEVSEDGANTADNLLALCPTCHALHHRGTIPIAALRVYKARLQAFAGGGQAPPVQVRPGLLPLEIPARPRTAADDLQRNNPESIDDLARRLHEANGYQTVIPLQRSMGLVAWTELVANYWIADDDRLAGLTAPAWARSPYASEVDEVLQVAIRLAIAWCDANRPMYSFPWSDFQSPVAAAHPWFCLRVLGAFGVARLGVRPSCAADAIPEASEIKWEIVDNRMIGLADCKSTADVWASRCTVADTVRPRSGWIG